MGVSGGLNEIMNVWKCCEDEKSRYKAEGGGGLDGREKPGRGGHRQASGTRGHCSEPEPRLAWALVTARFLISFVTSVRAPHPRFPASLCSLVERIWFLLALKSSVLSQFVSQ